VKVEKAPRPAVFPDASGKKFRHHRRDVLRRFLRRGSKMARGAGCTNCGVATMLIESIPKFRAASSFRSLPAA